VQKFIPGIKFDNNYSSLQRSEQHESNHHEIAESIESPAPDNKIATNIAQTKYSKEYLKSIDAKLPLDWKAKLNKKGHVYYFNLRTRESQWEYPNYKKKASPVKIKNEIALEDSSSGYLNEESSNDTQKDTASLSKKCVSFNEQNEIKHIEHSESTTDATSSQFSGVHSDTNASEQFKLVKEQFRDKLSKFIVKLLAPYMKKEECKVGYLNNVDDFKFLARKFTHTIMDKELSRTTKFDDLDLDKRVRVKTEEYVKRYMARFGREYSRKTDEESSSIK
jgi:hypothetical protein